MLGFFWRSRAQRRLNRELAIWYHPEYAPECLARTSRTLGVQVHRSELILDTLGKWKLVKPGDVRTAPLASLEDLSLFHPMSYLESTQSPEILGFIFGIDVAEISADELVRSQRFAAGGTIAAAEAVSRGEVATGFNLGGGFHHAEPAQGGGFCIYNDVAAAIAKLRSQGFHKPIAIIDLDYHQGNGNAVAFAADPSVLIYSIDGSVWSQVKGAKQTQFLLPPGTTDQEYLGKLRETLSGALLEHQPGLVFYIAGNDVLEDDALGEFRLTQKGVAERDRFVVETVRGLGTPPPGLVVTMSGGYSVKSWQSTASFLHWLLTDHIKLKRWPKVSLRREFAHIARSISPSDLQKGLGNPDDFDLTEADIMGDLIHGPAVQKVLGFYTLPGVQFALERYGILKKLADRGFEQPEITADLADESRQLVRVYGYRVTGAERQRHLIAEVVVRRQILQPPRGAGSLPAKLEMLGVEWLLLQNPTIRFSLDRRPLPGQSYPGLGMAKEVLELFRQACNRLKLDGLSSKPSHYHNGAVAFALGFHFLEPSLEGRLIAMKKVFGKMSIADAAQAIEAGKLRLSDGTTLKWETGFQVLPVTRPLVEYFTHPAYQQAALQTARHLADAGLHLIP